MLSFVRGGRNLEIFGANLAAQCLAPVLLGGGVRLYGAAEDRGEV